MWTLIRHSRNDHLVTEIEKFYFVVCRIKAIGRNGRELLYNTTKRFNCLSKFYSIIINVKQFLTYTPKNSLNRAEVYDKKDQKNTN